jgi:hypothetical protein
MTIGETQQTRTLGCVRNFDMSLAWKKSLKCELDHTQSNFTSNKPDQTESDLYVDVAIEAKGSNNGAI